MVVNPSESDAGLTVTATDEKPRIKPKGWIESASQPYLCKNCGSKRVITTKDAFKDYEGRQPQAEKLSQKEKGGPENRYEPKLNAIASERFVQKIVKK